MAEGFRLSQTPRTQVGKDLWVHSKHFTLTRKTTMKNRYDLEEAIGGMAQLSHDIDTIMYAYSDSPIKATEDEILNMLIGTKQLHEARYQKMWSTFEELIKNEAIK